MREIILNLFKKWACCHEWEQKTRITVVNETDKVIAYKYIFICKKCGKIKKLRV